MKKNLFLTGALLFVSACSQFEPFIDARREAGQVALVGSSTADNPVVCSGLWVEPEERLVLAEKECAKIGKKAKSVSVHSFECKLFAPVKETFSCVKGK